MMNDLIGNIELYISDAQEFINDFDRELEKKENRESTWYDTYNIVMYYRDNINYCIDKYEIHCRALRDKLNEHTILHVSN